MPLFPEFPKLDSIKVEYYKSIPTLTEIGYDEKLYTTYFKGGETEALRIMTEYFKDKKKVALF
jgi:hypothetical protein